MFVKVKKIWTKKFSKKEIEEIWDAFINATPLSKEEWENTKLLEFFKKNHQVVHPETDKWDDTEGIQPKQIKEFLKIYSLKDFEKLCLFLNTMAARDNNYLKSFISDGFISWESFFNQVMKDYYSIKNIEEVIGKIYIDLFDRKYSRYQFDKSAFKKIGENLSNITVLDSAIKMNLVKGNVTKEHFNLDSFFETRKVLWKKVKGITPQSKAILLANPNNFDKSILLKVEELFGTKQIAKLKENQQNIIAKIINMFGINALAIPKEALLNIETLTTSDRNDINISDYRVVLNKFKGLSIREYLNLINMFKSNNKIFEDFKKKDKISKEDIDLYLYIDRVISYARSREEKNALMTLDLYFWKVFQRYGVNGPEHIVQLATLFEKNKDNKCTIPNIKGSVNKYEFEMIQKNNPIGLILGYATDCCQTFDNNGEECLIAGYERENSTFFVVKKKNKIYAQSWVWEKTTKEGKRVLCFDSIEVLGKDLNKSKDILQCYLEASSHLKYDYIIAGADGNSIPKGIESLGEIKTKGFVLNNDLTLPFSGIYSDAKGDIVLIKGESND